MLQGGACCCGGLIIVQFNWDFTKQKALSGMLVYYLLWTYFSFSCQFKNVRHLWFVRMTYKRRNWQPKSFLCWLCVFMCDLPCCCHWWAAGWVWCWSAPWSPAELDRETHRASTLADAWTQVINQWLCFFCFFPLTTFSWIVVLFFPILHLLAEGTLVTGLEVAPVHSPCPTEAHSQPQQQDRRHPIKKIKQTTNF